MDKKKAVFVTIIMMVMLLAILALLATAKVFFVLLVLLGIFAGFGLISVAICIVGWLSENDEAVDLTPVEVAATTEDEADMTYEAIRREVQAQL